MMIVTQDAERSLYNSLVYHAEKMRIQKCLYFRASALGKPRHLWFSHLMNATESIANGNIGQIFICHDDDVFILLPHWNARLMDSFKEKFFSGHDPQKSDAFFSLFEIRTDKSRMIAICERKIERLSAEREKMISVRPAGVAEGFEISQADALQGRTRREKRLRPEIMVVEDDALARMMIKNVLMQDYDVSVFEHGRKAIEAYMQSFPDAVFLDIGLPDIDGHAVLKALHDIDPDAYIIMFSGRKDQQTILQALDEGAMGYVTKPFTRGRLYQYLEQAPSITRRHEAV